MGYYKKCDEGKRAMESIRHAGWEEMAWWGIKGGNRKQEQRQGCRCCRMKEMIEQQGIGSKEANEKNFDVKVILAFFWLKGR